MSSQEKLILSGKLIRISSYETRNFKKPNIVKLYSTLFRLKDNPRGFDKMLIIEPGDASLITMIVDTSMYEYANSDLEPMVEAVKIIFDHGTWWMFSHDIHEVLTD